MWKRNAKKMLLQTLFVLLGALQKSTCSSTRGRFVSATTTAARKPSAFLAVAAAAAIKPRSIVRSTALLVRGGGEREEQQGAESIPYILQPETWASGPKRGWVLMDAFCPYHGLYLSQMAREAYGVGVVHVLSDYMAGYLLLQNDNDKNDVLSKRMPSLNRVEEWKRKIPFPLVGLYCESDSGLADAERLGDALQLPRDNGIHPARRDKHLLNQVMIQHGLEEATIRQKLCSTLDQAIDFFRELETTATIQRAAEPQETTTTTTTQPTTTRIGLLGSDTVPSATNIPICVVKPVRGCASQDVFSCRTVEEVRDAFETVHGSTVFGSPKRQQHGHVLVQEFVSGTEYAVDTVSRNGQTKVAALWQYDKRPANGAPFVYHATELVSDDDCELGQRICHLVNQTLQALGIQWGTTHTEVIVDRTNGGRRRCRPRLVEVNCRQHNTDFAPLTTFCVGYNALDMVLASYLDNNDDDDDATTIFPNETAHLRLNWNKVPARPSLRAHGAIVHLVNRANGTLAALNVGALHEIQSMESVAAVEVYPHFCQVGSTIEPTVDICTDAGWVHLIHEDPRAFRRDYNRIIVELMPTLFRVNHPDSSNAST